MTTPPKKKLPDRPTTCDDFVICVSEATTSSPDQSGLPVVLRLIRQGFGPDPRYRPKIEELEKIERRLSELFDPLELAMRLLSVGGKKQSSLLRDLRNTLATKVRHSFLPPVSEAANYDQISSMLSHHVSSTTNETELAAVLRKAVIALSIEAGPAARSQLMDELLQQAANHRNRKFDGTKQLPPPEPYKEHLSEVQRIVSKAKVDFKTIHAARRLRLPLQVELEERRRYADSARRDKTAAEEARQRAEAECRLLNDEIAELKSQLASHKAELQQHAADIDLEKKKSNEIRETLTTRHAHELDGQIRRLTKALMLEVEEALICLNRDEPNAKMAMNRIQDMRNLLKPHTEAKA